MKTKKKYSEKQRARRRNFKESVQYHQLQLSHLTNRDLRIFIPFGNVITDYRCL